MFFSRYDKDPVIWRRNREIIEVMFTLLNNNHIFPQCQATAQAIADWFTGIEDERWEYAFVDNFHMRKCTCPFTGYELDKKELTNEEYNHLSGLVFKYIVTEKMSTLDDIASNKYDLQGPTFVGTRKSEIKSFLTMVYNKGPFDMVFDGLNLIYNIKNSHVMNKHTVRMADFFTRTAVKGAEKRRGKRLNVLIVFRKHIQRLIDREFADYASVWYASNNTRDDPFFLYAAILSGRQCDLVTMDLMKDIKYTFLSKLDFKDAHLLFKWQQIHQDLFAITKGKMVRQKFDLSIQRGERTWHIPYSTSKEVILTRPVPNEWLCLKRVS